MCVGQLLELIVDPARHIYMLRSYLGGLGFCPRCGAVYKEYVCAFWFDGLDSQ